MGGKGHTYDFIDRVVVVVGDESERADSDALFGRLEHDLGDVAELAEVLAKVLLENALVEAADEKLGHVRAALHFDGVFARC